MATIDITISQAQYDQMILVFAALRAKLPPLREPLRRAIESNPAAVKAFVKSDDGRLIKQTYLFWRDLSAFFDTIGIEAE